MKIEELFATINRYLSPLNRRKWLIIAVGLMAGVGFGLRAYFAPVMYRATTVFHPESGSTGASGLMIPDPISILMGSADGSASDQQMIGVLQSKSISGAVVADTIPWNGSQRLLADVILEERPQSFSVFQLIKGFFVEDTGFTYDTKIILASQQLMREQSLETSEQGFIVFSFGFYNPRLCQLIAEKYIANLISYYTKQKTAKAQLNVDFFTERTDSVKRELDIVAAQRARAIDQEQYRVFARDMVSTAELDARLEMLKEMYIQLVASREQFIAQLKRETPIIQVLDPPRPPFDVEAPSVLIHFLGGLIGVIFLLCLWITRREWISDGKDILVSTIEGGNKVPEEDES